jgi:ubiquinone/menaquinone biosynthesis C-methylase UbiE
MPTRENPDPKRTTTSALAKVRRYWDERATAYKDDCSRVEAGPRGQIMRFQAFATIHDLEGASVLDVGCGTGDFYGFLKRSGISCKYLGVDISDQMVERSQEKYPDGKFRVLDVLNAKPPGKFDYVVSFAIHNVKVKSAPKLLEEMTRRQFELCRLGAHVSILTSRYPGFAPHIQSWRAEKVLTLALNITPFVVLRHDYLPNDFSVTLYRKPLIDTRKDLLLD